MSSIEKPETERSSPLDDARPETDAAGEHEGSAGEEHRVLAGRYRLLAQLARGGVGIVWRAIDVFLDREVAVKELRLPHDLSDSERESLLKRTTREARVAARLTHPGVVTVLDVVDEDGRPWIVMELVIARTLSEIIELAGPLPYQRVAEIGLQLIHALQAAHEEEIIHRDVKPDNVMISDDGRVVLTDFGLAAWSGESSLTTSGRIVGSPSYIPPERARAGSVGPASDLWSLGATLYTAVEGNPPYDRKGYIAILRGDTLHDPPPAANAGPLAPVLAGLLHVKPEDRLTAENASKMLRIAALAPWAPDPEGEEPTQETADAERAQEEPSEDGEDEEDDRSPERAREHFRAGAHILTSSLQESVSSAIQRGAHAPESVSHLMTSIRESTDTLGLTSSGRHRNRRSMGIVIAVGVGIVALLTIVVWALLLR